MKTVNPKMMKTDVNCEGRSIFLVSTPIQLFFAYLNAQQIGLQAEYLIATDFRPAVEQISVLSKLLALDNVCRLVASVPTYQMSDRFHRLACESLRWLATINLQHNLAPGDRIFLGLVSHASHRPLFFDRTYELAFFDEGAATIVILDNRRKGRLHVHFPRVKKINWFTGFYPQTINIDRMNFFTIYPGLKGGSKDNVTTIKPQLPPFLCRRRIVVPEIWYISSPLVEAGLISENRQRQMLIILKKVSTACNCKLCYYRHRTEKINAFSSRLEIRETHLPFEVYYGLSEVKPLAIVSVTSSVNIHMKLFFNEDCPIFYIDPENDCDVVRIEKIQKYGKHVLGIEILKLGKIETNATALKNQIDGSEIRG